jgi:MFS family permease
VISLFGDRVNQIALGAFVYELTKSPLAVALTFFSGTIPNLVFSPLAGAFVDRWDQKRVMVVSDLLRAALVIVVPAAVLVNVWLAYPLVFVITTVSIFFRPARAAALPRIVPEEDLLAANSAMWVGETLADVVNYPLAGLFVVFLASSLPLAFWFDAATYLASAALLATIVVPPVIKRAVVEAPTTVIADLKVGWAFLRRETVLLANTLQGTAGQFAVGIMTVASIPLAQQITTSQGLEYRATYAFMETSIGLGNLIGGFVLGLVAAKVRKGPMVAVAYAAFGILIFGVGNASTVPVVLALLFGVGVANMAFVIPSQTLFQLRTPPELIGRVVSFRFALVFGGMSIAMAVGGLLIGEFGPGSVIAGAGVISAIAGLGGLLVKSVREA